MNRALVADTLTALRIPIAIALAATIGTEEYGAASILLAVSWTVDYFDGMAARASSIATRLGEWDPVVDAGVGAGILIGFQISGHLPAWLVVTAIAVLGGGLLLLRNQALGILLQAFAYVTFALLLIDRRPGLWWVAFGAAASFAVVGAGRLFREIFPKLFGGLRDLFRVGGERRALHRHDDS